MPRTLSTVESAIEVLERFDADHSEWTLSDLARTLNQPTSTVHEQLSTLTSSGLLLRIGRGRYRLGWRLLKLSSALYGSLPWYSLAHEAMEKVARRTHLLAFVCVLQADGLHDQKVKVLCIARSVQGRDGAEVMGETQFELPPHATASGKLLLALAGQALAGQALAVPTQIYTPQTIASAAAWAKVCTEISLAECAQSLDEWETGTSGLAVPLKNAEGEVLAALGVSLPTQRMREKDQLIRELKDAADKVNWALGYRK